MTFFLLVLQAAAVTFVFTRGSIFEKLRGEPNRAPQAEARIVRLFRDLVGCPLCSGVWIGAAYYAAFRWGSAQLQLGLNVLGWACVVGVAAALVGSLVNFLDPDPCSEQPPEEPPDA